MTVIMIDVATIVINNVAVKNIVFRNVMMIIENVIFRNMMMIVNVIFRNEKIDAKKIKN